MILDILYRLKKSFDTGLNIIINWEYDKNDEDMKFAGKDFADLVGIPINLKNIDYN
ncbi:MAG: DUF1987 domain-containing protein [Chlorobi bacterium]|nr:DUF1987 domain-containing protein [Chlorobiota bacterium]